MGAAEGMYVPVCASPFGGVWPRRHSGQPRECVGVRHAQGRWSSSVPPRRVGCLGTREADAISDVTYAHWKHTVLTLGEKTCWSRNEFETLRSRQHRE